MFLQQNKTPMVLVILGTILAGVLVLTMFYQNNEPAEVPEQMNTLQPAAAPPVVDQPGNAADGQ